MLIVWRLNRLLPNYVKDAIMLLFGVTQTFAHYRYIPLSSLLGSSRAREFEEGRKVMSFVKGHLKRARDAISKKEFNVAKEVAQQVLEHEPTNYNA